MLANCSLRFTEYSFADGGPRIKSACVGSTHAVCQEFVMRSGKTYVHIDCDASAALHGILLHIRKTWAF